VNNRVKGRGIIPDLNDSNGSVITENFNKANPFNYFFSSVFTNEDTANIPYQPNKSVKQPLPDINFTCDDVLKLLQCSKPDKSPGPDLIHLRVLKECPQSTDPSQFYRRTYHAKSWRYSRGRNFTPKSGCDRGREHTASAWSASL